MHAVVFISVRNSQSPHPFLHKAELDAHVVSQFITLSPYTRTKMAERSNFLSPLQFVFMFSLLFPSILSRKVSLERTAVFDVSASIERTKQVIKLDPKSLGQDEHKIGGGSFVLSLHPRSSLHKSRHKDYESLTLSRLARDSSRVDSIIAKLNFALGNFNMSDLKPVEIAIQPEDLQSPVTSGVSQGSGEYFTRLGIGTPAKQYYMVLDTGNDINWIQCQPCSDCYQQSDPIYNPSDSSSYRSLSCSSSQCNSLHVSSCSSSSDSCLYQLEYGDGSFTVGNLATETMSFGSSGSIPKVTIGCGHDNEGLFVAAAGLLGLGGGSLSLPSQIKAKSFSYCLVDRDSTTSSTLEFNSAQPANSVTAPLLRNSKIPTFFYVGVTGLSVGGQLLSIPPSLFQIKPSGDGGIIVDSGTTITRLTTQAYNSLRDSFRRLTQDLPSAGSFALFDTCYDLSSMTRITVPTVAFHFAGGKTLSLHPKNYLVPISGGKFCFAFAPTSRSLSIIGNVQQQGIRVSYDFADSVVGFSADKC